MVDSRVSEQLLAAVKEFARAAREAGEEGLPEPKPFPDDSEITVTEVAIVVDAMLRAVDMDIFEIQMWRTLGRN